MEVNYFEWLSMQFEFTNNQSPLRFGSGDRAWGRTNKLRPVHTSEWTHMWDSAGLTHVWIGGKVF